MQKKNSNLNPKAITKELLAEKLEKLTKDEIIEICLYVTKSKNILFDRIDEYECMRVLIKDKKSLELAKSLTAEKNRLYSRFLYTHNIQEKHKLYLKLQEKEEAFSKLLKNETWYDDLLLKIKYKN